MVEHPATRTASRTYPAPEGPSERGRPALRGFLIPRALPVVAYFENYGVSTVLDASERR